MTGVGGGEGNVCLQGLVSDKRPEKNDDDRCCRDYTIVNVRGDITAAYDETRCLVLGRLKTPTTSYKNHRLVRALRVVIVRGLASGTRL